MATDATLKGMPGESAQRPPDVLDAAFFAEARDLRGLPPPGAPEIAFAGRSNVGKSTLLNRMAGRRGLARTSKTPGRTRGIVFFDLQLARPEPPLRFVDLPGYGYARVSKDKRAEWRPLIEGYLRSSPNLRGIVQLLDVRHDPTKDDRAMLDFLGEIGVPTIIVVTKIDKLTARDRPVRVDAIVRDLALDADQVIAFSAETGEGRDDLAEAVESLLAQPSWKEATA
jgi:GTP-binding protein